MNNSFTPKASSSVRYRGFYDATHNVTNMITSEDFALEGFQHRITGMSEGNFDGAGVDQVETTITFETDKPGFYAKIFEFIENNYPSVKVL